MDELIEDFVAETREMLEALGEAIVAWEAAPQDRARLDEIFRFVHTVKGNCAFFHLPRLEALSHAAEDALAELRSGARAPDRPRVSAVLAIVDRILALVEALETGEAVASGDDRALIEALRDGAAPADPVHRSRDAADRRKPVRTIRVPTELLDRLMNGVSEMVRAEGELAGRLRRAPPDEALDAAFQRVSASIAEIRDALVRARMQRIDNLFGALSRMVRDLSKELGKTAVLELEGGEVELDRDSVEMVRGALVHIVRNAIDHGIEPPNVRLAAGKEAAGRVRVRARHSGNQVLIEIEDDGRGIDGEELARRAVAAGLIPSAGAERLTGPQKIKLMFEPGLSTAPAVTAVSGRGVGMDVVRTNLERIGGDVEVDSRLGQGVRLILRVPVAFGIVPPPTAGGEGLHGGAGVGEEAGAVILDSTGAAAAADPVARDPCASAESRPAIKRCLVVDDSKVIRMAARHFMETLNFAVDEAEDGREALARVDRAMPDVILLDWNMPVMGGIEFLQALRRAKHPAQPKVVFCTSENELGNIRAAMDAGADGYVMKPFDRETLEAKLRTAGVG